MKKILNINKNKILPKDILCCVIIVNWNGLDNTVECLNSILKVNNKNIKIIVIDNGSTKNEAKILKEKFSKDIEVHRINKNTGYTGGVNYGIKISKKHHPEYYLLLNNDTIVDKNFLNSLFNFARKNKKFGIISPVIYNYFNKKEIIYSGGYINWYLARPYHNKNEIFQEKKVDFITGCCAFVNKKLTEKIGLLDESFFAYFEDVAYSLEANKNGFTCYVIPQSIVFHKESSSLGKKSKIYTYLFSRNRILFVNKYTSEIYKKYFFLFNVLKSISVLLYFILTFQHIRWQSFLRGYIDGYRNIGGEPKI